MRYALELAREHDKPSTSLRAGFNLADCLAQADRYDEGAEAVRDGLALARKVGNRYWEHAYLGQVYPFFASGAWDELVRDGRPAAAGATGSKPGRRSPPS